MFDEQPDGDIHGECSAEIKRLRDENAALRGMFDRHQALLDAGNHYTYFELAYTRQTGWMVWICSKPSEKPTIDADPASFGSDRRVIAMGQGLTPEDACRNAMERF